MNKVFTINSTRPCNGCTACCEGWLSGEAYGAKFSPGIKCKFLTSKSCSIYPVRPTNPCKTFQCYWKINTSLPEYLKPNVSNVIILQYYIESYRYLRLIKTGKKTDPRVYEWAKEYSESGNEHANVIGFEDGKLIVFSKNKDFKNLIEKVLGS